MRIRKENYDKRAKAMATSETICLKERRTNYDSKRTYRRATKIA